MTTQRNLSAKLIGESNTTSVSFRKILGRGTATVAFLLPLKLSLTYIALVPLLLLFLYSEFKVQQNKTSSLGARLAALNNLSPKATLALLAPLLLFFSAALVSAGAGIAPIRSVSSLGSLIFFSFSIALFARYAAPQTTCLSLIAGQSLAGLHTVLEATFPAAIPALFLGKVTESGQLAITLFVALGVCWGQGIFKYSDSATSKHGRRLLALSLSLFLTVLFTTSGFHAELNIATPIASGLLALALGTYLVFGRYLTVLRLKPTLLAPLLSTTIAAPLLITSLLLNLKRGPWLGVFIGLTAYAAIFARRLIAPIAIVALTLAVSVAPLKERILASYQHFTIYGGRSTIWRIGGELLLQFPLGVGYHNSGILREFAPEIPKELKHFHNNIINITAETGWLGGSLFIWFIFNVLRASFRSRNDPLCVAIGCGVLSWQVAGMGEYNFGDSEVTILIWMLLGVLIRRSGHHSAISLEGPEKRNPLLGHPEELA